jgi:predicted lactoylglutathione lyase
MTTQVFINLPVKNLDQSIAFFTKLGYAFNPQFTDKNAACMIVSETIYVMLIVEEFFRNFTKKEICDSSRYTEAIICLSAKSREDVDQIVSKAVAAGATVPNDKQDQGFMYGHGFQDLDNHLWEFMYMDLEAIQQG